MAVALRHEPRQLLRGAALSGVVCAVLLTPHIVWLVQNHFPTFDYAATSLDAVLPFAARWNGLLHFLASQALRLLPALLLICMLHIQSRRAPRVDDNVSTQHPHATLFWTIHALGPLVLMSLMGGIAGVDLQMHWGTAFLWALPMWYLSTRHGMRLMRLPRAQMLAMIITVQSVLMTGKIVFPDL